MYISALIYAFFPQKIFRQTRYTWMPNLFSVFNNMIKTEDQYIINKYIEKKINEN